MGRKGVKEQRHVYCKDGGVLPSPGLDTICWQKRGSMLGGDSIPITDVKAVVLGRMTKPFLLHDKGKPDPKLTNLSFSIITKDRSLDLECGSEKERADWLDLFAFLLRGQLKESALVLMRKH